MEVTYKKHINVDKENRTEFLLVNWDYEDGHEKQIKQSASLTTFKTASFPPISNQLISSMRILYTCLIL